MILRCLIETDDKLTDDVTIRKCFDINYMRD